MGRAAGTAAGKPRRGRQGEAQRSLRCELCGAGNPVSREIIDHGWTECTHCASPLLVPGRGDFVPRGPHGWSTRLVRPGSSEIETSGLFVFRVHVGAAVLVGAELAFEALLQLVSRVAPALHAELQLAGVLALGLAFAGLIVAGQTYQRLEVRADRIDHWFVTLGRRWKHRTLSTRQFHSSSKLSGRTGVELVTPDGSLMLYMRIEDAIRWLEREVDRAILDARNPRTSEHVPCPGCGGPVAEEKALVDAGAIDCPHCGTALVHTEGGVELPPARIGHRFGRPEDAPEVRPRTDGDSLCFESGSFADGWPWSVPLVSVPLFLAFVAGTGALAWWGVWSTPHLKVFCAMCAGLLSVGLLYGIPGYFQWLYGRHVFRVGPRLFEHELRVGRFRRSRRFPLARLVRVEAARKIHLIDGDEVPSGLIQLKVETATDEVEIECYGLDKIPEVRAAVEALPARLRALGRGVEPIQD
jgi:hypothetical protein